MSLCEDSFIKIYSKISNEFKSSPDSFFLNWEHTSKKFNYHFMQPSFETRPSNYFFSKSEKFSEEEVKKIRDQCNRKNIQTLNRCAKANKLSLEASSTDSPHEIAEKIFTITKLLRNKDKFINEEEFKRIVLKNNLKNYGPPTKAINQSNDPLGEKITDRALNTFYTTHSIYKAICELEGPIRTITKNREHIVELFSGRAIRLMNDTYDISTINRITERNLGLNIAKNPHRKFFAKLIESLIATQKNTKQKISTNSIGYELELEISQTYKSLGYRTTITSQTGDFGIDIIATSNSEKIGIQCKNLTSTVGVEAIMQAYSGGKFYDCTKSCVITTQGFTNSAIEMANKLGVELLIHRKS